MDARDKYKYLHEDRVDFVGNIIKVGDKVALLSPYYRDLIEGVVTKITPKKISIDTGSYGTTTRYAEQVIKIIKNGEKERKLSTD